MDAVLPFPDPLIELKDLSFSYGERPILDGVSLTIPRGKSEEFLRRVKSGEASQR